MGIISKVCPPLHKHAEGCTESELKHRISTATALTTTGVAFLAAAIFLAMHHWKGNLPFSTSLAHIPPLTLKAALITFLNGGAALTAVGVGMLSLYGNEYGRRTPTPQPPDMIK